MIRKMQIQTTGRCHLTPIRMAAAKQMKKEVGSYRGGKTTAPMQCWQNGKWGHVYGKYLGSVPKIKHRLNIHVHNLFIHFFVCVWGGGGEDSRLSGICINKGIPSTDGWMNSKYAVGTGNEALFCL